MSLKRRKVLERRAQKKERALRNKRETCERMLEVFGLTEEFRKLPEGLQERVRNCADPPPIIKIGEDHPSSELEEVAYHATRMLNWTLPLRDQPDAPPISYCELTRWFDTLRVEFHVMAKLAARYGYRYRGQHVDPRPAIEILRRYRREKYVLVQGDLAYPLCCEFGEHMGLDKIFWMDKRRQLKPGGKAQTTILIRQTNPGWRRLVVEGRSRTAYRLFRLRSWLQVSEAFLPASAFGLDGGGELPVYIQQHAMDRMGDRLCYHDNVFLFSMLDHAIEEPRIIPRPGGEWLIEVRYCLQKLGYFVARLSDEGAVVLTTFLFLTMQGTPESDRLRDQFRLVRADMEFTMLDSLRAFTHSDMGEDETLMRLFETCGCGHLFRLVDWGDETEALPNQAKAVRDHLRIVGDETAVIVNGRRVNLEGVVSPSLRDYRAEWEARTQAVLASIDDNF